MHHVPGMNMQYMNIYVRELSFFTGETGLYVTAGNLFFGLPLIPLLAYAKDIMTS